MAFYPPFFLCVFDLILHTPSGYGTFQSKKIFG